MSNTCPNTSQTKVFCFLEQYNCQLALSTDLEKINNNMIPVHSKQMLSSIHTEMRVKNIFNKELEEKTF